MVDQKDRNWQDFVSAAAGSLWKFQRGEIGIEEAIDSISAPDGVDEDVIEFVCDSISEMAGNPDTYRRLMLLLERGAPVSEIRELMSKP